MAVFDAVRWFSQLAVNDGCDLMRDPPALQLKTSLSGSFLPSPPPAQSFAGPLRQAGLPELRSMLCIGGIDVREQTEVLKRVRFSVGRPPSNAPPWSLPPFPL